MMDLLKIVLTSLGSLVTLFILTKLMGYREVSEMSMFDYINGITIGSIAAEMATDLEKFEEPLVAMITYSTVVILISIIGSKSIKARRFLEGKPLILMNNDEIFYKNLAKARVDIDELLSALRNSGYFDISQIQSVVLESNGKFSILPKADNRPATPQDLGLNVQSELLVANVIIDGHIMQDNLKHTGNDENWLHHQLHGQGVKDVSKVLLATCDTHNTVTVYTKDENTVSGDIFE